MGVLSLALGLFAGSSPASANLDDEARFVELLNTYRATAGLGPLDSVPLVADLSRTHSEWMAANDTLEHAGNIAEGLPDGYWLGVAENIGFASLRSDTVQALHDGFVNSPGHERNMTGPNYDAVGVGVAIVDNTMWVTYRFVDRPDVPAPILEASSTTTTAAQPPPTSAPPSEESTTLPAGQQPSATAPPPTTAVVPSTSAGSVEPAAGVDGDSASPAAADIVEPPTTSSTIDDDHGATTETTAGTAEDVPVDELAFAPDQGDAGPSDWLLVAALLAALVACTGSAILIFRTN